jgi:hypothetical protein
MAGSLLVMLPPILVVLFMQRWFVKGVGGKGKVMYQKGRLFGRIQKSRFVNFSAI